MTSRQINLLLQLDLRKQITISLVDIYTYYSQKTNFNLVHYWWRVPLNKNSFQNCLRMFVQNAPLRFVVYLQLYGWAPVCTPLAHRLVIFSATKQDKYLSTTHCHFDKYVFHIAKVTMYHSLFTSRKLCYYSKTCFSKVFK